MVTLTENFVQVDTGYCTDSLPELCLADACSVETQREEAVAYNMGVPMPTALASRPI